MNIVSTNTLICVFTTNFLLTNIKINSKIVIKKKIGDFNYVRIGTGERHGANNFVLNDSDTNAAI